MQLVKNVESKVTQIRLLCESQFVPETEAYCVIIPVTQESALIRHDLRFIETPIKDTESPDSAAIEEIKKYAGATHLVPIAVVASESKTAIIGGKDKVIQTYLYVAMFPESKELIPLEEEHLSNGDIKFMYEIIEHSSKKGGHGVSII